MMSSNITNHELSDLIQERYKLSQMLQQIPTTEESRAIATEASEHLGGDKREYFILGFQGCIYYLLSQMQAVHENCDGNGSDESNITKT